MAALQSHLGVALRERGERKFSQCVGLGVVHLEGEVALGENLSKYLGIAQWPGCLVRGLEVKGLED